MRAVRGIELGELLDAAGRSPFARWFEGLGSAAAARATIALTRLAQGNFSRVGGVGNGVYEIKIDFGPGYRVYFGKDGEPLVILLGGSAKKTAECRHRRRTSDVDRVQRPQARQGVINGADQGVS